MSGAFARWRANFYTGLAIVLPAVLSLAVCKWLFGTVANITDPLLFFLPHPWTHEADGRMYWWWSASALCLAIILIALIGQGARNFIGRRLIAAVDLVLLRVPVLNRIYGVIKQINEAFTSSNKTSFKQVVLIEFPAPGIYSIGFLTGAQPAEVRNRVSEALVSVFVPTTPNPTGGFVLLVPERQITVLEMSVADGIKYVLSLGSVVPDYVPPGATGPALADAPIAPAPAAKAG